MCLEMKKYCDRCGERIKQNSQEIFICSYENTYCLNCAAELHFNCPHCEGTLEKRPARIITEIKVIPVEDVLCLDEDGLSRLIEFT
jgi:hypothetical protein